MKPIRKVALCSVIVYFLFISSFSFSQETFLLQGKIYSQSSYLEGITVFNTTQNKGVYSLSDGSFSITVKEKDTLIFTAIHLKKREYIVAKKDKKQKVKIPMEVKVNQLDEITFTEYKSISPESLGIIPKGMKTFTPAERRLRAAGKFRWYSPLLIPLGGMSVDGLINSISGKTTELEKELEIEKKELLLEKLQLKYSKEYMVTHFKIPEDYVNGFFYYLIESNEFKNVYKLKDKIKTEFILSKLAVEFKNQLQK